jgi:hypothetical protein
MKKLFTFVFTLLLAGSLSFAQATGGSTTSKTDAPKTESGKKAKAKTKAHKGGKKSKKSSGSTTTPAPK